MLTRTAADVEVSGHLVVAIADSIVERALVASADSTHMHRVADEIKLSGLINPVGHETSSV
ncbi:hypothetical protein SMD44_08125 [Streptomyces alboflavus]|uniref:Uncharacterized protein n=1 Tax=Streptomyces alboflavus TaxID=67267 RepID=A0A1Z1WQC3_9ACTN|nr:hypothetical protein SMD44_08125 [Streptomyces alboflavus]